MNKLTKVVNIYPSMPITGVNPPIRSSVKRVTKSINEIRTCLMSRAIVEEIMPDGTTVRLNISNYDKCNNSNCECGGMCNNWMSDKSNSPAVKTPWQEAYENALAGKDLRSMTRKQRRSVEAAARAFADAAVAESESEVVMGVGSIENAEEDVQETAVDTVVEDSVDVIEEEVQTADIEEIPESDIVE